MSLWIVLPLFLIGLVAIIKGGDMFVDAASWMAEVSGVPKLIVGATVVSIATTLPELIVSLMATFDGKVEIAIGNVVGSATANTGLIMGISILFVPAIIKRKDYVFKTIFMLSATLILIAAGLKGSIGIWSSLLLLLICSLFFAENIMEALSSIRETKLNNNGVNENKPTSKETRVNIAKFVFGAILLVVGSRLLVDNGSYLAQLIGVSERIIGVTLIAIGTSLPELVTTLTAIAKKHSSLSVGNIIGANIIDLTFILPICSILSGKAIPLSGSLVYIDLPATLIVGCIALLPSLVIKKFTALQGVLLLATYFFYVIVTTTA